MGEEVTKKDYSEQDYRRFRQLLEQETEYVRSLFESASFDQSGRCLGYELELCLVDKMGAPAPCNQQVLQRANNPQFTVELARFNLEINGDAFDLSKEVFEKLDDNLRILMLQVDESAQKSDAWVGMFGVLPSLSMDALDKHQYMSELFRYELLNQRLMAMRGEPVHLEIHGEDDLRIDKGDVMLEALGTSLQIHYQLPFSESVDAYHAALWASMAVMAAGSNSPLVLDKRGWQESRIAIFKQAVDSRNAREIHAAELPRVHLAPGYIESWMELFEDNLDYSPILPEVRNSPLEELHHFNLHNGTIWRWVRPIIGSSLSGDYHLRLECRAVPAGPTRADTMANLVFHIGLIEGLRMQGAQLTATPYEVLEHGFYEAARQGLDAEVCWCNGRTGRLGQLVLDHALPDARRGLKNLGIENADPWLDIIQQRVERGRTGAQWILNYWARVPDANALVRRYMQHASKNIPVHLWPDETS